MPRVRLDGGLIGVTNNPSSTSSTSAGGIWSFSEHSKYTRSSSWPAASNPVNSVNAIVAMIGGGGGSTGGTSGVNYGAGGAGGVLRYANSIILTNNPSISYTVTVGAGGTGILSGTPGSGSNSTFSASAVIATGGGGVSSSSTVGANNADYSGGVGSGTSGAGGGAGAGGNGAASNVGGPGANIAISGTFTSYGGGGGGVNSAGGAAGGAGGGGAGSIGATVSGTAGTGGGGGGGPSNQTPANGGSGTVIINYPAPQQYTGGTVTNVNNLAGSNIVHTFTTSGSLNALATPIDTYFPQTTLLLHGDGTNGANNTMFIDSSSNTYIPFDGTYSNFIPGNTHYLTTSSATSSAFEMGSGDYTVEFWFYALNNSDGGLVFKGLYTTPGNTWDAGFGVRRMSATQLRFYFNTSATLAGEKIYDYTTTTNLNQWYHVAMIVSGGVGYAYVNGTLVNPGGLASIGSIPTSSTGITIGSFPYNQGYRSFYGYISNLRIIKGTALYTSNFTPSTSPLTAVSNTQLLTSQSTWFIDNSTNNFTITSTGSPLISSGGIAITTNGKPQQGTFSPFSQTGWSNYFNGTTGNYLTTSGSSLLGTNFTIDFFLFTNAFTSSDTNYQNLLGINNTVSTTGNFLFLQNYNGSGFAGGSLTFFHQNVNKFVVPAGTFKTGQWQHVALVRSGGTSLTMYLNGVSVGSASISAADQYGASNAGFIIGSQSDFTGRTLSGYISNLRVLNGTVLYTSNFIPPINQFTTSDANTILLTANTNRFIGANSTVSNVTITTTGTPQVQPFSPFSPTATYSNTAVGGSVYFNGSTDYLSLTTNSNIALGASNWTVECWIYPTSVSIAQNIIFEWRNSNNTLPVLYLVNNVVYWRNNSATQMTGGTLSANTWHHIAVVKNSGTTTLYISGVSVASFVDSFTYTTDATFQIGKAWDANYFNGYISNARFIKGTALYTANFTPPTAPLTAVSGTVLLLNATNAGIIDNTGKNTLTTYGTAAVSNTQSKFGNTSMYFDGSTSYLTTPSIQTNAIGTGDFTIECWIYPTNVIASQAIVDIRSPDTAGAGFDFYLNSSGKLSCSTALTGYITGTATISNNTWTHIALVRNGTSLKTYVNGTQDGSTTNSANFTNSIIRVGGVLNGYFTGYIDDLRISKFARYTTNFTPPTSTFLDR